MKLFGRAISVNNQPQRYKEINSVCLQFFTSAILTGALITKAK